jgi:hypothetical protein
MGRYVHSDGYGGRTSEPALWNDAGDEWWIGVCNACQNPVLVHGNGDVIYPSPGAKPTDSNVPKDLRADLDEAKICFAAAAFRGCAVLARRVIQVACIAKGAKQHSLVDQIAELTAAGVITKDIEEWAHVVRWVGNDAAHPNAQAVTQADAEDCLNLAEQFLHVICVAPAIAKARRTARGK